MGYLIGILTIAVAWWAWGNWAGTYEKKSEHATYTVDIGGPFLGWRNQPRPQLHVLTGSEGEGER